MVLNLPSVKEVMYVDPLARLTGSNPIPAHKKMMGYKYEPDKLKATGLSTQPSLEVRPPRLVECPIQLEAVLVSSRSFGTNDPRMLIPMLSIEVQIVKVHADESIISDMYNDRIDPEKWNPLLMSFLRFYGRGKEAHSSRLSEIPEETWGGRHPKKKRTAS